MVRAIGVWTADDDRLRALAEAPSSSALKAAFEREGGVRTDARVSFTVKEAVEAITQRGVRWDDPQDPSDDAMGSGARVTYGFLSEAAAEALPGSTRDYTALSVAQQDMIEVAIGLIEDVAGIDFVRVDAPLGVQEDADIALFGETGFDGAWTEAREAGGRIEGALVNVGLATEMAPGSFSFFAALNQIGFAIGLSDPRGGGAGAGSYGRGAAYAEDTRQYTMMSAFSALNTDGYYGDDEVYAPMLHDVAALQRLYGANEGTRTGDDTYGQGGTAGEAWSLGDGAGPERLIGAIWDAGGTDTFDAGTPGYGYTQTIDLRQGAFSSTGGYQANVAIAYGTVIENARGGDGEDLIVGNAHANRLDGRGGRDAVSYEHARAPVVVDLGAGTAAGDGADTLSGIEDVIGSGGADRLTGDAGANALTGGDGDDTLAGGAGDDLLEGGAGLDVASFAGADRALRLVLWEAEVTAEDGQGGTDTLSGMEGAVGGRFADVIEGAQAAERLWGGRGDDTLVGNEGADRIEGGAGDDVLYGDGAAGYEVIGPLVFGTAGADRLSGNRYDNEVRGLGGDDTISGGEGADSLYGGDGDDLIFFVTTDAYADGGAGDDTLDLSGFYGADPRADLLGGEGLQAEVGSSGVTEGPGDFIAIWSPDWYEEWLVDGFEHLIGTERGDRLYVAAEGGTARGGGGDDELSAHDGQSLWGGEGNDHLRADGVGATLTGGADSGGLSRGDRFFVTSWSDDVTITDFGAGAGRDKIALYDFVKPDRDFTYVDWDDVTIMDTQEGALVSIDGGRVDGTVDVLLIGVEADELSRADFEFYG